MTSRLLLEALRDLQIVTDESVWHAVTEFIEPLEVFRNTVKRWGAERAATAPGPDVPDNVNLLLDPQLLCDSFRAPKAASTEDPADGAPAWSRIGPLPLSPAGLCQCFSIPEPPGEDFRYPFCDSTTTRNSQNSAAWVESACEVLGQAVVVSQTGPVSVDFSPAASAVFGPVEAWFLQGGWHLEGGRLRSPAA